MNVYILTNLFAAESFSTRFLRHQRKHFFLLEEASKLEVMGTLPLKIFKPKFNLPVLQRYDIPAGKDYWCHWPKNFNQNQKQPINVELFKKMAIDAGFHDLELLEMIYSDLKYGAKLGCKGRFREPTKSSNAPSSFEYGERVSDSICEWIKAGYAAGPYELDEIPDDAKISGLMVKFKPNGKARLI